MTTTADAVKQILDRIEMNEECIENFGLSELNRTLVEKENEFLYEIMAILTCENLVTLAKGEEQIKSEACGGR